MNLELTLNLSVDDFVMAICRNTNKEIIDAILAIDLRLADVGFTVELIKRLKKSLLSDLDKEEIEQFLND